MSLQHTCRYVHHYSVVACGVVHLCIFKGKGPIWRVILFRTTRAASWICGYHHHICNSWPTIGGFKFLETSTGDLSPIGQFSHFGMCKKFTNIYYFERMFDHNFTSYCYRIPTFICNRLCMHKSKSKRYAWNVFVRSNLTCTWQNAA